MQVVSVWGYARVPMISAPQGTCRTQARATLRNSEAEWRLRVGSIEQGTHSVTPSSVSPGISRETCYEKRPLGFVLNLSSSLGVGVLSAHRSPTSFWKRWASLKSSSALRMDLSNTFSPKKTDVT